MGFFTSFQLKSRDAATRRKAATRLGAPGKTSAIAALEPLLDDPEWPVREGAAQALGAIGGGEASRALVAAVRKADGLADQEGAVAVRRAAVEGLSRAGASAVPALLEALRDRQPRVREAAIEALGGIGGAESVAALAGALNDDRSNVRQAAAPALARAGGADAVPALQTALAHKDPATRRAAAAALGVVQDPAATGALGLAVADRERGVREAAVQSLVALASPGAVGVLCAALLEGDKDLRAAAAAALHSFTWSPADAQQRVVHAVLGGRFVEAAREGETALGPLLAALSDRDTATRRGAAEALSAFQDPRAVEGLASLLGDQDAGVRAAAADALAGIGPTAAAAPLVRALEDRGPSRPAALRAITAIGHGAVASALLAPLRRGTAASHGGAPLRVVGDRETLDDARVAADGLAILVAQGIRQLPPESLHEIAALEDVVLIEPGRVPDPGEGVSCEALRKAATKELARR